MAADEILLQGAASGQLSLRFYRWTQPTLSLGYFQPSGCRMTELLLATLPYVRRPTGGATLVHDQELTYALALPAHVLHARNESWLPRMHGMIAAGLQGLGVPCHLATSETAVAHAESVLCFRQFTPGDVLCAGAKVVGSAQRKRRHGLLQHGTILLARSTFAPGLQGIQELCGRHLSYEAIQTAVTEELVRQTGWQIAAGVWSEAEQAGIADLATRKYQCAIWNDKR